MHFFDKKSRLTPWRTLFASTCLGLALSACATSSMLVQLDQEAFVSENGEAPVLHKKGDEFEVSDTPVMVFADGYWGMVVLPPATYEGNVNLGLRRMEGAKVWTKADDKIFTDMISRQNEVATLLGKKKGKDALAQIEALVAQYPEVSHFLFMKASTLYYLGEKDRARDVLLTALKRSPENRDGLALQSLLDSGKPVKSAVKAATDAADTAPAETKEQAQ